MTEKLSDILFYSLEKSIKTYRQFAQRNINQSKFEITIDQWLVLKTLHENHNSTQQQVAELVFKDYASVTRIIELLVKKKYITRSFHAEDRRRFELSITNKGVNIIASLQPIIISNRSKALKGCSMREIEQLHITLNNIISNCQS
jgi:DNA-binding MarR family transcriptional regulator